MIRVNGNAVEWREGMTVADALRAMAYDFPLITVIVNGEIVEKEAYEDFAVPDGADVKAIHIHHGG